MVLVEELLDPDLIHRWIERGLVVVDQLDLTARERAALQLHVEVGRAPLRCADVRVDRRLGEWNEDADLQRPHRGGGRGLLRAARGAGRDADHERQERRPP